MYTRIRTYVYTYIYLPFVNLCTRCNVFRNAKLKGVFPQANFQNSMTAKQRPIVKLLRRFLAQSPPNNVAPHVEPNQKLKAVIAKSRGRLAAQVQQAEKSLLNRHLRRMLRLYS